MGNQIHIDENLIAAFVEGKTNAAESLAILRASKSDPQLRAYLEFAGGLDCMETAGGAFPFFTAAAGADGAVCCVKCEQYVMRTLGIACSLDELIEKSLAKNWLKENGTPLLNIGKLSEDAGLTITRKIDARLDDIASALNQQHQVIVMVDGGELSGDYVLEKIEDETIGEIPDHTIVVLMYDSTAGEVICYDPMHGAEAVSVPVERFLDAWEDSKRYMVTVH